MRSTFTKIFLSFWLTQILIAICTIFIAIRQFESVTVSYSSSFAMMQTLAKLSIQAYDVGGCQALKSIPDTFFLDKRSPADQPAVLFDPSDHPLCQQIDTSSISDAVRRIRKAGYLLGERHGAGYLLGLQVKDARGQNYVYLARGTFPTQIYIPFREMLPRFLIGVAISILVTFGTTLVFTRPIGSLREAARQLAAGNLTARAKSSGTKANGKSGDELRGLVYDFNVMAERLQSLVDSHKLLLRDVSHELRSPLARLSVALEWAREEAQPGIEEQLERMESEVVRLNALIGQLLSLSHLESATNLPSNQQFSVTSIVEDLLPDMEYEARRRNCSVSFTNAGAHEFEVTGSPELLGRALENVIRNAIAYTAEGTAVEVAVSNLDRAGKTFVVLQIRDHGPGVPETALQSIFHPFYRLDSARRRSTGGFGVGLAIAERAVQLHEGTIVARNAAGGGLVVEISLPAAGNSAR
jgi:two-component system, OmpR family, sensor histidine kinase CpxA